MPTDDPSQGEHPLHAAETDPGAAFDMRAFVTRYFALALDASDTRAFTELFTPDGVLEDPVGTPPLCGRDAIGQFLAAGRALIERTEYEIRDVLCCGRESAVRWSAVVTTRRGHRVVIEGIGIFCLDDQRKLRSVREFYDVASLQQIFSP